MISLAVKYRPTTFNDVVAQENIKAILRTANCYKKSQKIVTYLLAVLAQVKQPVSHFANELNGGKGKSH